jgi:hypothetical protein
MTKTELIESKLFPTYEEWYEMNKDAFELLHNSLNPHDVYNEYLEEALKGYPTK